MAFTSSTQHVRVSDVVTRDNVIVHVMGLLVLFEKGNHTDTFPECARININLRRSQFTVLDHVQVAGVVSWWERKDLQSTVFVACTDSYTSGP